MTIQIIESSKAANVTYFRAQCGNRSAHVAIYKHGIQVVNENAAHRVWRGSGRLFRTVDEALAGFKTGEMKAIIQAAVDFNSTN